MEKYIHNNWLGQLLSDLKKKDQIDQATADTISNHAQKSNKHDLYKLFKRYFGISGLMLVVLGLLLIVGDLFLDPEKIFMEKDGLKKFLQKMSLVPAVIGGGLFYLYLSQFKSSRLWKETVVPVFFGCVALSFPMALYAYGIDFINNKIIIMMVLAFGLFLIYKFNSSITAFVYLYLVGAVVAVMTGTGPFITLLSGGGQEFNQAAGFIRGPLLDDYPWMLQLLWLFLAALIPFFKIKLENAKNKIGLGLALLGWVFVLTAVQFAYSLSAGYAALALMVVLPAVYLMSKRYYSGGTWAFYRPGSTALVGFGVYMSVVLSNKDGLKGAIQSGLKLSDKFEFSSITSLIFIVLIGAVTYLFYKKEIEAKNIKINYVLLAFPAVLFLAALIGSNVGYILFSLYAAYLAWTYLKDGLSMKFAPLVVIGGVMAMSLLSVKIMANMDDQLKKKSGATVAGIVLIFLGATTVGLVGYCKDQWSVTDDIKDGDNDNLLDDAMDSVSSIKVDDIKSSINEIKDDISDSVGGNAKSDVSAEVASKPEPDLTPEQGSDTMASNTPPSEVDNPSEDNSDESGPSAEDKSPPQA